MPFIRHPKDFYSGLIFIAFGIAAIAIVIAKRYALGTAARMGPGYFPRILGIMLILLGAALSLRGLRIKGSPVPKFYWRPTLVVLGSVILFGYIVNYAGLMLSTIILIVLSSWASTEFRLRESLISGVILAALVVGVFVVGLKLQLPIWPAGLG